MKRGYTLIEQIVVIAIVLILTVSMVNIKKSYSTITSRLEVKGVLNELTNMMSFAKYYCRNSVHIGVLQIDTVNKKIKFRDKDLRDKIIKEINIPKSCNIYIKNTSISINNKGHLQSESMTISNDYYWGKITISTGVDNINIYEGDISE